MEAFTFDELHLSPEIQRAIKFMGFEEPSLIQEKAIPVMLEGHDLIGQAQTGTGKTAAFGIPILEKLDPKLKKLQAVVLCPTRELAIQVADEIRNLAKYKSSIKVLPIYGGQEIGKQIRSLKSGAQIIIGTPGRVMDHMRRRTLRMDDVSTVVMDEADEMLNMGFREDMETILSGIQNEHQTVLFSATMSPAILEITKRFQHNAKIIKVVKKELTVPQIEQFYYEVRPKDKEEVLSRLLDLYAPKLSIVFCNTKKQVDSLVTSLLGRGYFAAGLHGDLRQEQRDRVMKGFRTGKTDILVATDVAARGIDVDEVEAVFNYDLPQDDEYYVHRIGRTGRAGRVGYAFSFVSGKEVYKLRDIQRYCKTKIYAQKIPTANDVAGIKMEHILDQIDTIIHEKNLTPMVNALQNKINHSDFTALDIAAAFLYQQTGAAQPEEAAADSYDFGDTGSDDPGMTRLFINIGKKQKVRPGDILGAIAGESGISGKLIGRIDMYDNYTFVDIPRENAKDVLYAMQHSKIKGKSIAMEPANQK
ncbi:MAG: DEAD/DEAH box helicase [Lachnospiraceae bacterium]